MIRVAIACLLLSGCTTYQLLDRDELSRIGAVLRPGDDVRVITLGGEQIDLTIDTAQATEITGGDVRILVSDVRTIEMKRFNKRRAWIIAGAVAGALLLIDYDDDDCIECFPVFP